MKTRRSFLASLLALPIASSFIGASCQPGAVIPAIQASLDDAALVLSMINTGIDAYFAGHPNAALQAKIDNAMTDAQGALRVAEDALTAASDINAANVQQALAAFQTTFNALVDLIGQIGIQVGATPNGARAAKVGDKLIIAPPKIFQHLKAKTSMVYGHYADVRFFL
jgi:hypothetical protein